MNLLNRDAFRFIDQVKEEVAIANTKDIVVGIAPSYLCLATAVAKRSPLLICAQNVNEHPSGAYTGEVSIEMLKEIAINFLLLAINKDINIKMKPMVNSMQKC